jgi:hypothetical protein
MTLWDWFSNSYFLLLVYRKAICFCNLTLCLTIISRVFCYNWFFGILFFIFYWRGAVLGFELKARQALDHLSYTSGPISFTLFAWGQPSPLSSWSVISVSRVAGITGIGHLSQPRIFYINNGAICEQRHFHFFISNLYEFYILFMSCCTSCNF